MAQAAVPSPGLESLGSCRDTIPLWLSPALIALPLLAVSAAGLVGLFVADAAGPWDDLAAGGAVLLGIAGLVYVALELARLGAVLATARVRAVELTSIARTLAGPDGAPSLKSRTGDLQVELREALRLVTRLIDLGAAGAAAELRLAALELEVLLPESPAKEAPKADGRLSP